MNKLNNLLLGRDTAFFYLKDPCCCLVSFSTFFSHCESPLKIVHQYSNEKTATKYSSRRKYWRIKAFFKGTYHANELRASGKCTYFIKIKFSKTI